jgi:hypothetical protein
MSFNDDRSFHQRRMLKQERHYFIFRRVVIGVQTKVFETLIFANQLPGFVRQQIEKVLQVSFR